jgi:PST family polysaccharide transporter
MALVIGISGLVLADRLPEGLGPLLTVLAIVLPLNAVEGVANGVLLRRQHFRGLALRGVVANVAALAAGVSLALMGAGAWAVVGQQITFFGTAAVLAAWFARLVPGRMLRVATLREMAGFAAATVANGMAERAGFRLFLLVVAGGHPALAGIMQIAFRIVEVARELPTPFVHRYGLPALSRLRTDPPAFRRRLRAVCFLAGIVFAPVFTGLAFCAREVQAVALGPAWAGVIVPVQLLSLALAVVAFYLPLVTAFAAVGRPALNLWLTLGSIALPLLLAPLVQPGDAAMAAAVWAVTLLATGVAGGLVAARVLRFRLADQLGLLALALVPASAVAVAVLGAEAAGLLPMAPLAALLAKAAIGGIAGLPLMVLLGRSSWREASAPVAEAA